MASKINLKNTGHDMKAASFLTLALTLFVFLNSSLFAKEPLLPSAEDLARRMIKGVDIVKLVLYKVLTEDYLGDYKSEGEDFCKDLAATTVNEIFNDHNETTSSFLKRNKENIEKGIINLGEKHPDLKQPVTDALRIFVQANWMLSGDSKYYSDLTVFQNAMDRGIFIKGGDPPEPASFLKMVEELAVKYKIY